MSLLCVILAVGCGRSCGGSGAPQAVHEHPWSVRSSRVVYSTCDSAPLRVLVLVYGADARALACRDKLVIQERYERGHTLKARRTFGINVLRAAASLRG